MIKALTVISFLLLVIGNQKIAVPIVLLLAVTLEGVSSFEYFGQVYVLVIILSLLFLLTTAFFLKPFGYHRQITLGALLILLLPVVYFAIVGFKYYLNIWVIVSHLFFIISCIMLVKRLLAR